MDASSLSLFFGGGRGYPPALRRFSAEMLLCVMQCRIRAQTSLKSSNRTDSQRMLACAVFCVA